MGLSIRERERERERRGEERGGSETNSQNETPISNQRFFFFIFADKHQAEKCQLNALLLLYPVASHTIAVLSD